MNLESDPAQLVKGMSKGLVLHAWVYTCSFIVFVGIPISIIRYPILFPIYYALVAYISRFSVERAVLQRAIEYLTYLTEDGLSEDLLDLRARRRDATRRIMRYWQSWSQQSDIAVSTFGSNGGAALHSRNDSIPPRTSLMGLPAELRTMIWEHVYAEEPLHVFRLKGRRGLVSTPCTHLTSPNTTSQGKHICVICKSEQQVSSSHQLASAESSVRSRNSVPWSRLPENMLGLALACKQTHSETYRLLYTRPVFDPVRPNVLTALLKCLPSKQLQWIQKLNLVADIEPDSFAARHTPREIHLFNARKEWKEALTSATVLTGLQELSLSIHLRHQPSLSFEFSDLRAMLLPITLFSNVKDVDVKITFNAAPDEDVDIEHIRGKLGKWPFDLKLLPVAGKPDYEVQTARRSTSIFPWNWSIIWLDRRSLAA